MTAVNGFIGLSNRRKGQCQVNDNLIRPDFQGLLYKTAGFFSLKKYKIKKDFNKHSRKDLEIAPTVYWRFIDEVSAFTKR